MPKQKTKSFLNAKNSLDLPSNLLRKKQERAQTLSPTQQSFKPASKYHDTTRYFKQFSDISRRYTKPMIVQEKGEVPDKNVLYKRLSNIRNSNQRMANLSFSKMLSRMVVVGQTQDHNTQYPFDFKMRQTTYSRPLKQKNIQLELADVSDLGRKTLRSFSRASDYEQYITTRKKQRYSESQVQELNQNKKNSSNKLFKRYYLPNSQMAQTIFLQTIDPNDKYVYENGKRVECKRIHNFYTSNMFRNGYDRCFRKSGEKKMERKL